MAQDLAFDDGTLIERLRALGPELRAQGLNRADVYGSRARGQARPDSDLDLLVELEPGRRFTLIDLVRLENRLTEVLGVVTRIDTWTSVPAGVRDQISAEAVTVF